MEEDSTEILNQILTAINLAIDADEDAEDVENDAVDSYRAGVVHGLQLAKRLMFIAVSAYTSGIGYVLELDEREDCDDLDESCDCQDCSCGAEHDADERADEHADGCED